MTDFERLELLLRRHGFLCDQINDEDRKCIDGLLTDLPQQEAQALHDAREEFLNMVADGAVKLEIDGDETGDCSTITITTGWRQLRDLIDVLDIPDPAKRAFRAESDIVMDRIAAAVTADFKRPDKLPDPTKCEGCSEPATLCETCALDRAASAEA